MTISGLTVVTPADASFRNSNRRRIRRFVESSSCCLQLDSNLQVKQCLRRTPHFDLSTYLQLRTSIFFPSRSAQPIRLISYHSSFSAAVGVRIQSFCHSQARCRSTATPHSNPARKIGGTLILTISTLQFHDQLRLPLSAIFQPRGLADRSPSQLITCSPTEDGRAGSECFRGHHLVRMVYHGQQGLC